MLEPVPAVMPQEVIARKRDKAVLRRDEIVAFVRGIASGEVGEAQMAAFAMAVCLNGMTPAETAALTRAMRDSGATLNWVDLDGPILDKHSTGGVGDKVSLILAPVLAACGAFVPMLSGRGLGHTGGTLDKLESLTGYDVRPDLDRLRRVVREAGCAIVGAGEGLAPADARLYAVRDVTATVASAPLIVASILAKKLAEGAQALVMDVKCGSGAFLTDIEAARGLADALVETALAAGLPCRALVTDMDWCVGHSAGNALEVAEAVAVLRGEGGDPRLRDLVLALAAEALAMGGIAAGTGEGRGLADRALASGEAAERFGRMVRGLGGPDPFVWNPPTAPVVRPVPAPRAGRVVACDVRALGQIVVRLGGGRTRPGGTIDAAVGLSGVRGPGSIDAGEPLATVHARSEAAADEAAEALRAAFTLAAPNVRPEATRAIVLERHV